VVAGKNRETVKESEKSIIMRKCFSTMTLKKATVNHEKLSKDLSIISKKRKLSILTRTIFNLQIMIPMEVLQMEVKGMSLRS
jgi:hypothetical protein